MKCIFPLTLIFLMTSPIVAYSEGLSSFSTKQVFVANPAMDEELEEKEPNSEQVQPTVPSLPNDSDAQNFPENITDHPAVISPPVIDSEIRISPPVTDPEMAVNPENLPTHPEEAPIFPR